MSYNIHKASNIYWLVNNKLLISGKISNITYRISFLKKGKKVLYQPKRFDLDCFYKWLKVAVELGRLEK